MSPGATGDRLAPSVPSDGEAAEALAIIGHDAARAELVRLATQGGVHAFAFYGPAGVGRRAVARWFAACLNCEAASPEARSRTAEPCGRCASCRRFAAGAHPDYREVAPPATTSTGRRQRRPELRIGQLVRRQGGDDDPLAPWLEQRPHDRVKVGVIDGAEALNPAAANAFLKVLEEPPSWARIVLIAPNAASLLPTVASRCTPVRFGPVDPDVIEQHLPGWAGHPALRLGRPGPLMVDDETRERIDAHREAADGFARALERDLDAALDAADALEKAWADATPLDPGDLLRSAIAERYPGLRGAAESAIERCETALEAYANAGLAVQRLTLELRGLLREHRRARRAAPSTG